MNHLRILKIITFMFLKGVASSIVNNFQVWGVTQNIGNAYDVLFSVGQQISEGENKKNIASTNTVNNQVTTIVTVKYLDKETKVTQLSQFELTFQKYDNWKIIMKELLCKYIFTILPN